MDITEARKQRGKEATAQQRRAADPRKSVWVEASAGTGKTKVLSDRVLRLLLSGVSPSKILCLTYTKAAAVEMNSRIAGRLSRWAVADAQTLDKELAALLGELPSSRSDYEELEAKARQLFASLLDTPGGMKIQTIHSFCQEILKRFPLEAQVSPYFEVMDDRSAAEAVAAIKQKLLQKIENEPDSPAAQALGYLTRKVSEYKFPEIMNGIADNRNKIIRLFGKYRDAGELLEVTAAKLGVNRDDDEESLTQRFLREMNRAELKSVMEALAHGSAKDIARSEVLAAVLSGGAFDLNVYRGVFLTTKNEPKSATKGALAFDPNLGEKSAAEAERILEFENALKAVRLLNSTKAVLLLAGELISGYNQYKRLHSKMDYEDLIVLTRSLLENPAAAQWVLYKLDGGIDSVLIDEAQDTSPDQWAVVKALTEEFFAGQGADKIVRTVFAVGDRKQSIYSFQGADPEEFENMRRYFKSASDNFEEIRLDVSFRSTSAVLESVDKVFAADDVKPGVVEAAEHICHTPFRAGESGRVEIWPLVEPEEGDNPDVWLPPVERVSGVSTSSRLAQEIALRIKKMVSGGEILVSQNRPVRYRDFMVLVQRRNSFVEELIRACKNAGVNIGGADKIKLLEQIAIQDLVGVGKFLLLPTDDLNLAEILKSPLFGLDDDDLFKLCYERGGASLWTRLRDFEEYGNVYRELQALLNMADYVRPFELYAYILNRAGGRRKFVERMGIEVEDGIDEFINLTLNYELEHVPSLQGFIDWIGKDEVEIKREQEQSEADAVRIMTVHGSKGLQAPIVILPDTVRVVSSKKESGMLWDEVMFYPLSSQDYEQVCCGIKDVEQRKALEEYRRLLYVALTRAEDRLCICGYRKKTAAKPESWYEICRRTLAETAEDNGSGELVFETPQEIEVNAREGEISKGTVPPLPEWSRKPAEEEAALTRPYTPSRPDDIENEPGMVSPVLTGDGQHYRRGRVIHKLLQFMPDVKSPDKAAVIERFLAVNAADMPEQARKRIEKEVLLLLEDERFAGIFGPGSRAEVPVMGLVNGKIISGQIDRLAVNEKEVLIVDFKTNRPAAETPAEIPLVYLKQLESYKSLLGEIYPGRKIRTLILWTDTARLMETG